jgi:membrane protein DedA with SNARE-associated domain
VHVPGPPLSTHVALVVVHDIHHLRHVRLHRHHLHRHRFPRARAGADYVGVFLAAAVSWVAFPGPGEAALIAASISAAHGHLDLTALVAIAWAGASAGGMAGWIVGVKGGRTLLVAPGALQRLRLGLIARGDRFYERFGALAVLFTPSWMAGIHNMRWSRFLLANTLSALVWAAAIGAGAYLLGPSIADIVADAGAAGVALVGVLLGLTALILRRRSSSRSRG